LLVSGSEHGTALLVPVFSNFFDVIFSTKKWGEAEYCYRAQGAFTFFVVDGMVKGPVIDAQRSYSAQSAAVVRGA
jgi:hypothetical protein